MRRQRAREHDDGQQRSVQHVVGPRELAPVGAYEQLQLGGGHTSNLLQRLSPRDRSPPVGAAAAPRRPHRRTPQRTPQPSPLELLLHSAARIILNSLSIISALSQGHHCKM